MLVTTFLSPKHLEDNLLNPLDKFLDVVGKFLSPKHLENKLLDLVDKFLSPEHLSTG